MAKAMIGGILAKGLMGPNEIIGTAATEATCLKVANKYGIQTRSSNAAVAKDADIIFLAVKPQYLKVAQNTFCSTQPFFPSLPPVTSLTFSDSFTIQSGVLT